MSSATAPTSADRNGQVEPKSPTGPSLPWQIGAWVIVAVILGGHLRYALTVGGLDFSVYRAGAATLFGIDGYTMDLYARELLPLGSDSFLPFTYPPFAALIFIPMALLPLKVGVAILAIFSIAIAWWLAGLIYDYVNRRGRSIPLQDKLGRTTTIALLAALICLAGPWRRGLGLVQINPVIMLLVLWDFLRPATRVPRGLLIGLAGGIKLTPLAFGLILLMRKDIKGLLTLAASFGGTVLIGFLVLPQQSVTFWTSAVSDPSRVGNISYPDNISIQGWLMNLMQMVYPGEIPDALFSALHYLLILVLLVGVAAIIPTLDRRGMKMSVISLTAFVMLEMSPISWSHHNIWLPLIVAALAVDAFPWLFARHRVLHVVTQVLFWVAFVGLYISPLLLAETLTVVAEKWGYSTQHIHMVQSASVIPIFALYLLVMVWVVQAWRHRHDPVQSGTERPLAA